MRSTAWFVALAERFPRFRGRGYLVAPGASALEPGLTRDGVGVAPLDLFLLATSVHAAELVASRFGAGRRPSGQAGAGTGP